MMGAIHRRRLIAGCIDFAIAATIGVTGRWFVFRFPAPSRPSVLIIAIFAAALPAGYLLLRDAWNGKSVGKRIAGLKVVDPIRGSRASVFDLVIRNLVFGFGILPVLGWAIATGIALTAGLAILRGRATRIGEGLSDTRVIDDRLRNVAIKGDL